MHKARALHKALELAAGMKAEAARTCRVTADGAAPLRSGSSDIHRLRRRVACGVFASRCGPVRFRFGGVAMILVIDNYDSFTYNLVQLLAALGAEVEVRRNDTHHAPRTRSRCKPAGIVVSPGPGTPDDAGISRDVIRAAADAGVPVLGVCLGHQCVAEVYGGTVCRAPRAVHGKTDEISHDGQFLFAGIPSPFTATRYHSLCVDADSVPDALVVQATTPDGVLMGVRHRDLPVFGVQFHPESVLTPEGTKLLANFLDITGEVPLAQGRQARPGSWPLRVARRGRQLGHCG